MTGGFLYVIAFGPGGLSLDREAALNAARAGSDDANNTVPT
jgi:hypothetical protein